MALIEARRFSDSLGHAAATRGHVVDLLLVWQNGKPIIIDMRVTREDDGELHARDIRRILVDRLLISASAGGGVTIPLTRFFDFGYASDLGDVEVTYGRMSDDEIAELREGLQKDLGT